MSNQKYWPIYLSITLVLGMWIGQRFLSANHSTPSTNQHTSIDAVLQTIAENYVDSIDIDSLEEVIITQIMEELDPHSYYIGKDQIAKVNESLQSNFSGVGVEYRIIDQKIFVTRVIPGGPAFQAGIQFGDQIIGANDSIFQSLEAESLVDQLRGEMGSVVKVNLIRQKDTTSVDITRGEIPVSSVFGSYPLSQGKFYVKVERFASGTYKEFYEKISAVQWDTLIIDLRSNGGGFLTPATQMAELFLNEQQTIVSTKGVHYPTEEYHVMQQGEFFNKQLVILIDDNSASASEVLTGALKDHGKAIVIGQQSFGKGLVQNQFDLPNGGAIRLTIARYFTPNGRCIQRPYLGLNKKDYYHQENNGEYGIAPDIIYTENGDSSYYNHLNFFYNELINPTFFWALDNYAQWRNEYANINQFNEQFQVSDQWLKPFLKESNLKKDQLKQLVKLEVGHHLFGPDGEAFLLNQADSIFSKIP